MINTSASWFNGQGLPEIAPKNNNIFSKFVNDLPIVLGFLFLVLSVHLLTNERITQGFLMLLLLSILVYNNQKVSEKIKYFGGFIK